MLIGRRYLLLDIKSKLVYGVQSCRICRPKGPDFRKRLPFAGQPNCSEFRLVAVRDDIGPAESIRLTLGDYGRTSSMCRFAHPPDLRAFY